MSQVQVQCREHNTRCIVLRNVRLEGAGSNQQLSLSLRCPLSLMPVMAITIDHPGQLV